MSYTGAVCFTNRKASSPMFNLEATKQIHQGAAVAFFLTLLITLGIEFVKGFETHSLFSFSALFVSSVYHFLSSISDAPLAGSFKNSDVVWPRWIEAAMTFSLLSTHPNLSKTYAMTAVALVAGSSEALIGTNDGKLLGGFGIALLIVPTAVELMHIPAAHIRFAWLWVGRWLLVVVTLIRAHRVRKRPDGAYADPARLTRMIWWEHVLIALSLATKIPVAVLQVTGDSSELAGIFVGVSAVLLIFVYFGLEKAALKATPLRAETIAMSLLNVPDTS